MQPGRRQIPRPRLPLPKGQNVSYTLRVWITIIGIVVGLIALIEIGLYAVR